MHDSHRFFLPTDQAVKMHQARHVDTCKYLGSSLLMFMNAIVTHHTRYSFLADGKGPAKPTAFIDSRQFRELNSVE